MRANLTDTRETDSNERFLNDQEQQLAQLYANSHYDTAARVGFLHGLAVAGIVICGLRCLSARQHCVLIASLILLWRLMTELKRIELYRTVFRITLQLEQQSQTTDKSDDV